MNIGESSVAEDQMLKDNDAILSGEITATTYEEAANKLNLFVAKNIDIMKAHLINKSSPDIHTMNKAMVEYMPVLYSLQTLYNKVKFDKMKAEQEYDTFCAEAYISTRDTYNNKDTDKKLFLSSTEITAAYKVKYKNQIAKLKSKVDLADCRRSFVERLLKAWESYQWILGQVSRNLIAEANANKLDLSSQGYMPDTSYQGNTNPSDLAAQALTNA